MSIPKQKTEKLSQIFLAFADRECKNNSPLYDQLSKEIAQDEYLLSLAQNCRERQPIPNLFLAAVHYLLLLSPTKELATYYPSISKKNYDAIPLGLFKEFCKRKEAAITLPDGFRVIL